MKVPGMDRRRADILPAGAVVLDAILARLQAREILLCEWALREGILLDFAARQRRPWHARRRTRTCAAGACCRSPSAARPTPITRATWRGWHSRRSTRRAPGTASEPRSATFSSTRPCSTTSDITSRTRSTTSTRTTSSRTATCVASIRSRSRSWRTSPATTAGGSQKKHAGFGGLSRDARGRVLILAGLLRLAEALDRSHHQRVQNVKRAPGSRGVKLRLRVAGDAELELWGASRHTDLLAAPWAARSSSWRSPNAAPRAAPWRTRVAGVRLKLMTEAAEAEARRSRRWLWWTWARPPSGWSSRRSPPDQPDPLPRGSLARRALGKDTFTSGRISLPTMEARSTRWTASAASWTPTVSRASAPSRRAAVREASNRDTFLDRVRLRTGLDVEVIDGSEENRLTYLAMHEMLASTTSCAAARRRWSRSAAAAPTSRFLRSDEPILLGHVPARRDPHAAEPRFLARHARAAHAPAAPPHPERRGRHPARDPARRGEATSSRWAATCASPRAHPRPGKRRRAAFARSREPLHASSATPSPPRTSSSSPRRTGCPHADAETLVPALLGYQRAPAPRPGQRGSGARGFAAHGAAPRPRTRGRGARDRGVPPPGAGERDALGQKYPYDEPHARNVAALAVQPVRRAAAREHGLAARDRLLLEVAALLHDVGMLRDPARHHKHSQYILSVSEIFGLSRDDMALVAQRRPLPPARPAAEVPPSVHGARPRSARRGQQAGRASCAWRTRSTRTIFRR